MAERAAIYVWYRGDALEPGGEGPDVQEDRCRAYADARGYDVVAVFTETTSDPHEDRPGLKRLRETVWRRGADVVIATTPERIYQDVNRLGQFASDARLLGVRLEFLEMPVILEDVIGRPE